MAKINTKKQAKVVQKKVAPKKPINKEKSTKTKPAHTATEKDYTTQLKEKWDTSNKATIKPFLDLPTLEGRVFFKKTIEDLFIKEQDLSDANTDEMARLRVFLLIQMARYIAPRDNNEFLIRALVHLEKNPLFSKLISGMIHVSERHMNGGSLNLPELGVFVAPSSSNKYTFAIPRSSKSVLLVYLGANELDYTDQELIDFSYGTKGEVLVHESNKATADVIAEKQKVNERRIGNLCLQMEDPAPISSIFKGIVTELPGIKNNVFLNKPLEMAMKFWSK